MQFPTFSVINSMSDKRLLAYFKKVRTDMYAVRRWDSYSEEQNPLFEVYENHLTMVRNILNGRGHIARAKNPYGVNINNKTHWDNPLKLRRS